MKRILSHSIAHYIVAFIIVLGGCENGHDEVIDTLSVPVNFQAGMVATRLTDNGVWELNDEIGVYMQYANTALAHENILFTARNLPYKVVDTSTGALESDDRVLYYPQNNEVDFVAYYPYTSVLSATEDYEIPLAANKDVLYSKVSGKSAADPKVSFSFAHKMAKVTLNIKHGWGAFTTDDIQNMICSDVVFKGMPIEGKLILNDATTESISTSVSDFSPSVKFSTPATGFETGFSAMFVPHKGTDYSNRELHLTVAGEKIVWEMPDSEMFDAGMHYVYNVTVNDTRLVIECISITPWTTTESTAGKVNFDPAIEVVHVPAAGKKFHMDARHSTHGSYAGWVGFSQDYYISKYEITNEQYVEFLNSLPNDKLNVITVQSKESDTGPTYTYYLLAYETKDYAGKSMNSKSANPILLKISTTSSESRMIYYNSATKKFSTPDEYKKYPVLYVGWFGANEYALWAGGQLPTLAQWQYACGGAVEEPTKYYNSNMTSTNLQTYCNCSNYKQTGSVTTPKNVGSYAAIDNHPLGLCDMYANAMEWCLDKSVPIIESGTKDAPIMDPIGVEPRATTTAAKRSRVMTGSSLNTASEGITTYGYTMRLVDTWNTNNFNGGAFSSITGFRIIYVP